MIEILKCGPLTTVQDAGRFGYRHLGIVQAGAMDSIAQQQANLLLENPLNAAVLEISLGPLHVKFHHACAIVLMGADFRATLKSADKACALMPGYIHQIPAGAVLRLAQPSLAGMRAYLAVQGGFDVPEILGSRSTDVTAGFGGFLGRALQAGDRLHTGAAGVPDDSPADLHTRNGGHGVRPLTPGSVLRALRGPDYQSFSAQACNDFWQSEWRVSPQSNRMGLRLSGKALRLLTTSEYSSGGVMPVPPDGQPIVLGADAQTIGGYPRIASVIATDLWQLAYMPPGSKIFFQEVSLEQAHQAARKCRQSLQLLEQSLRRARMIDREHLQPEQHKHQKDNGDAD
jgi:5-oxoprolinase (ATP-hydrolysing) subunit C